jgi:hypothetical protein
MPLPAGSTGIDLRRRPREQTIRIEGISVVKKTSLIEQEAARDRRTSARPSAI